MSTDLVSIKEREISDIHRGMLSNPDWMIPISRAQRTYRSVYYGMTATALLEDVHFDSLANWLSRHQPKAKLERCVRGALGDYKILDVEVSHKSMSGPTDTGVNWNALQAREDEAHGPVTWTSPTPILVVSSAHDQKTLTWKSNGVERRGSVIYASSEVIKIPSKLKPTLVSWKTTNDAEVLTNWDALPSFKEFWQFAGDFYSQGYPAYEIELLLLPAELEPGDKGILTSQVRPGQYLLPLKILADLPVGSNNRAKLLKKETMRALLLESQRLELWTPLPIWPTLYSGERPPDLYLSLRADFDRLFSPAEPN
jgi:hypothetical protein